MRSCTIAHPQQGEIAFEPYPYQDEFFADDSSSRLILKARQTGISLSCAIEALYYALHGRERILFISKTLEDAKELLGYVQDVYQLLDDPAQELVRENLTEMEFANGSRIRSLPATKGAGRGFTATRVYLDEYAFAEYAAQIYRAVRPTLSRGGQLTILSTPDGQDNEFFKLWQGLIEGHWSKHKIHWSECPEYDEGWFNRERPNYTARDWASEYECDFVASGEAVFLPEDVQKCADGWVGLQAPRLGGRYVTAWDIGRRRDATVGITLDIGPRFDADGAFLSDDWQVVAFERFLGLPYPGIQAAIERRAALYDPQPWVEYNGVGDPVIENLAIEATPFTTTQRSKHNAITAMALAVEHQVLKHAVPQLRDEMLTYQWEDKKLIQDAVMACAIACWAAERTVPEEQMMVEDDYVEIGPQI